MARLCVAVARATNNKRWSCGTDSCIETPPVLSPLDGSCGCLAIVVADAKEWYAIIGSDSDDGHWIATMLFVGRPPTKVPGLVNRGSRQRPCVVQERQQPRVDWLQQCLDYLPCYPRELIVIGAGSALVAVQAPSACKKRKRRLGWSSGVKLNLLIRLRLPFKAVGGH